MKNYVCESNSTDLANEQRNHRSLRVFVTLLAALLYATTVFVSRRQNCTVKPTAISLGQTVRLSCQVPATKAN